MLSPDSRNVHAVEFGQRVLIGQMMGLGVE